MPDEQQADNAIYRETARLWQAGRSLIVLEPVDGEAGPTRYLGEAQVMTSAGPAVVRFVIEADSPQAAFDRYEAVAQQAAAQASERVRLATGRILVPRAGAGVSAAGSRP